MVVVWESVERLMVEDPTRTISLEVPVSVCTTAEDVVLEVEEAVVEEA